MSASRFAGAAGRRFARSSRHTVSRVAASRRQGAAKKLVAVGATATAAAFTLPMYIWPLTSGDKQSNHSGDVPVTIENSRRSPNNLPIEYPAQSSNNNNSNTPATGKRGELDELLDSIFGSDSTKFDPIEQIQRNVPRYLWPSFVEDIIDERQRTGRNPRSYDRYVRDPSSQSAASGSDDFTGQLVGFLEGLAPAHRGWWEWASELSRPFHLSLEDRGNEYSMRVMTKSLSKDEVRVKVNNGILTVVGVKQTSQRSTDDQTYATQSAAAQQFQQSIKLPPDADIGHIRAKFVNGGLDVTIPKVHNSWRGGEIRVE